MTTDSERIDALHDAVTRIDAMINNGLKAAVAEHRAELKEINKAVSLIGTQITEHIAREDIMMKMLARVVAWTGGGVGAALMILLSVIGYLLTHPVGLK